MAMSDTRLVFSQSLLLLVIVHITSSQTGFKLTMQAHVRIRKGLTLGKNFGTTMKDCFQRCLGECRCLSFDICQNNECYLRAKSQQTDASSLQQDDSCNHFEFKRLSEWKNTQQCDRSCLSTVNCCLTSNPCENGGRCLHSKDPERRFYCACPTGFAGIHCGRCANGYTGSDCQTRITSCRGYANGGRVPGAHKILDASGRLWKVYCDFDANSTMAWTLIQSYRLGNVRDVNKSFSHDIPQNQGGFSWKVYRLSRSRMESIQNDSTKWRITCDYEPGHRVILRDYLRASKSSVDILTFNTAGKCVEVEYVNVRGHNCTNCTVNLYQTDNYFPLHFDGSKALEKDCDFKPESAIACGVEQGGEDNFGMYKCTNPEHRCTESSESTTQTWLGG